MIRALIVDDQQDGRENLSQLVKEYCEQIEICSAAENIAEAEQMIIRHRPDLLFLDINMPLGNGFELLAKLETGYRPHIVFVTAYSDYTISAIRANAFDYLLKPIDIYDLQNCEDRLLRYIRQDSGKQDDLSQDTLKVHDANGIHFINIEEITFLKAHNNYTVIHSEVNCKEKSLCVSRTLGYFEELLPKDKFFRVHKSYLINVTKIRSCANAKNVIMKSNDKIEISRRKASSFRNFLKICYK